MKDLQIEGKVDRIVKMQNPYIALTLEGLYAGYIFVGRVDAEHIDLEQELKLSLTKAGDMVSFKYAQMNGPDDAAEITDFQNNNLAHYKYASDEMENLIAETPSI